MELFDLKNILIEVLKTSKYNSKNYLKISNICTKNSENKPLKFNFKTILKTILNLNIRKKIVSIIRQ